MAERTVKVKLVADVSDYTAGLVKAAQQTRSLGGDVERNARPGMQKAGRSLGDEIFTGLHVQIIRRNPLIAAAVAAGLLAGGPAVLAAASAVFGGVGAIAATQNSVVRESWVQLGHELRDGAVSDASVLVPVYVGMADKIGAAFQRMRPELREAFADAAPQIEAFSNSLIKAGANAMPGLLRAVERGGPVIKGLGSLMESVGQGLSDFLDAMSDNSTAAGQALEGLGDVLGAALPLLGELLGTGAELASTVLPVFASALGAVNAVAQVLSPVLAPLALGFAAFKIAGAIAPGIATLGSTLGVLAMEGGRGSVAMDRAGRALHGLSSALPGIGVALAGVGAIFSRIDQQATEWAQALLEGGRAAEIARQQMSNFGTAAAQVNSGFEGFIVNLLGMGAPLATTAMGLDQAEDKARELYNAMSPLDQRTQDVTRATNDLELAVGRFGPTSDQARAASDALSAAEAALSREQDNLARATDGVTQSMLAQAAAALAAANSDLAYRMSVDATEAAVSELATAIATNGAASEEAADAALRVEQAMLRQAEAARQSAFDTSTATSEAQKNAEADAAMLAELLQLRSVMGSSFPAALNTTISRLQGTTNAGMVAAAQFSQLGLTILSVPNSKTVIVSSTTPEQIALLQRLGFEVRTLPNGTVQVTAHTSAAEAAINYAARDRTSTIRVNSIIRQSTISGGFGVGGAATGGAIEDGRIQRFDVGGAVSGAGGPTSDSIPAWLSNGEHVWTAAEVQAAGGQAEVAALRRAVLSGREQGAYGRAGGGGSSGSAPRTVYYDNRQVYAQTDPRQLAGAMRESQRDLEFLHG